MGENEYYSSKVSDFQLKVSYWYVSHKLMLKRILVWFLTSVSLALFSYVSVQLVLLFVVYGPEFRNQMAYLTAPQIDYRTQQTLQRARPLEFFDLKTVKSGEAYDAIVGVRNPNDNFVAREVVLNVVSGGQIVDTQTTFLNPGEQKYVGIYALPTPSANVTVGSIDWRRVRDYDQFANQRLRFEVTDVVYKNPQQANLPGALPISLLSFKIANNSAYSYWRVGVTMVLFAGGQPVGINHTTLDQFESGTTREVNIQWYDPLPNISDVKVFPEVNIIDPASYMPVR